MAGMVNCLAARYHIYM